MFNSIPLYEYIDGEITSFPVAAGLTAPVLAAFAATNQILLWTTDLVAFVRGIPAAHDTALLDPITTEYEVDSNEISGKIVFVDLDLNGHDQRVKIDRATSIYTIVTAQNSARISFNCHKIRLKFFTDLFELAVQHGMAIQ
jgi:hypothetical protein